jgi:hypothetical protein
MAGGGVVSVPPPLGVELGVSTIGSVDETVVSGVEVVGSVGIGSPTGNVEVGIVDEDVVETLFLSNNSLN